MSVQSSYDSLTGFYGGSASRAGTAFIPMERERIPIYLWKKFLVATTNSKWGSNGAISLAGMSQACPAVSSKFIEIMFRIPPRFTGKEKESTIIPATALTSKILLLREG